MKEHTAQMLYGSKIYSIIHFAYKSKCVCRYNVMKICWKENPEERPDFQTLEEMLGEMLGFRETKGVCDLQDLLSPRVQ